MVSSVPNIFELFNLFRLEGKKKIVDKFDKLIRFSNETKSEYIQHYHFQIYLPFLL